MQRRHKLRVQWFKVWSEGINGTGALMGGDFFQGGGGGRFSLNIIIMWGGLKLIFLLNERGVWLSFGPYFTHFPAPPPLQVIIAVPYCISDTRHSLVNTQMHLSFAVCVHQLSQSIKSPPPFFGENGTSDEECSTSSRRVHTSLPVWSQPFFSSGFVGRSVAWRHTERQWTCRVLVNDWRTAFEFIQA